MIKNYTDKDYADKAVEANREGKMLYVYTHDNIAELLIAEPNYYICYEANYTNGTLNPDFDVDRINALRSQLNDENTKGAKRAVEQGYVEFKNAQFETNAQTVGDLTATMLLMQASGMETYSWLSKDDKVVELTLADFGTLGGLIAGYKAHIWNEEYLSYKEQIAEAQTYEELKEIKIIY